MHSVHETMASSSSGDTAIVLTGSDNGVDGVNQDSAAVTQAENSSSVNRKSSFDNTLIRFNKFISGLGNSCPSNQSLSSNSSDSSNQNQKLSKQNKFQSFSRGFHYGTIKKVG